MRKFQIALLGFAALLLVLPETSHSVPAFARKYGFNCNMCHVAFTKLNDFGQRFRDNGYQLPGQEGLEKNVFEIAPPLAFRTSVGHTIYNSKAGSGGETTLKTTTSGFHIYGFDFLAAGVMHKNVSFLLVYKPRVDVPQAAASDSGPSQLATFESANIVFSNIVQNAVNLRVGMLEPAYQAISMKRSFYLLEPYEVYDFRTPHNSFNFGDNQIGVEATGHFNSGFKYGLGVVNGNGFNPDNNTYRDIYVNLFQTFGRGDGQAAGQRIGAFAYYGWQPNQSGFQPSPTGDEHGTENKPFSRIGGDISLNYSTFNLSVLFLAGQDDKTFNWAGPTKAYKYTGGFAEFDYAGLANNRLLASVLYNWVTPPSYDNGSKIWSISGLLRYYLGDWMAVNVALHAEYTHRVTGKDNPLKEDLITALVDFDF